MRNTTSTALQAEGINAQVNGFPCLNNSVNSKLPAKLECPKEVFRCGFCQLVQFETRSGTCRRCNQPLPLAINQTNCVDELSVECSNHGAHENSALGSSRRERSAALRRSVATRIREQRLKLEISQVQFARRLGIPRSYVSRVENMHLLPGPAMLRRFTEMLGIEFCSVWAGVEATERVKGDPVQAEVLRLASTLPAADTELLMQAARMMAKVNPAVAARNLRNVA